MMENLSDYELRRTFELLACVQNAVTELKSIGIDDDVNTPLGQIVLGMGCLYLDHLKENQNRTSKGQKT